MTRAEEFKMFGCYKEDIDAAFKRSGLRATTHAVSILSNLQEFLSMNPKSLEEVRQGINCAKYIIMEYCQEK